MAKGGEAKRGLELLPHQVVERPIVTEKATHLAERRNVYCFRVHPTATKAQIKHAIEVLFEVRVAGVRTCNRLGKKRRFRQIQGRAAHWKKAMVELSEDSKINYY